MEIVIMCHMKLHFQYGQYIFGTLPEGELWMIKYINPLGSQENLCGQINQFGCTYSMMTLSVLGLVPWNRDEVTAPALEVNIPAGHWRSDRSLLALSGRLAGQL